MKMKKKKKLKGKFDKKDLRLNIFETFLLVMWDSCFK